MGSTSLTACDAYVNHHEVLAVARQIRHGAVDVEPTWALLDFESLWTPIHSIEVLVAPEDLPLLR